jgi:hypothetical protein
MEDWRVHEGNTVVGGGNDGDGVLIKDDVGARWPTHQTGESDSPVDAKWKGDQTTNHAVDHSSKSHSKE